MKAATIFHLTLGPFLTSFLAIVLALPLTPALAQDSGYLEPSGKYRREELAQMLAPIALYPDALLSQVLMASTYPIEVIEADRWVRSNPNLKGEVLDAALLNRNWDPSVKAICHFPSILALMSERITETTNLGNAFLAQEAETMDMVQELRAAAYAQGNLATTSRQQVIVEKEIFIIEPADPRVIYVPYYDPFYVYGPWWYPAYPPYYWGPAGVRIGYGISYWPGFYFGIAFGNWSYFDWHRHSIYIDVHKRPRYVHHDRWLDKPGRWQHAPIHRRGVAYHNQFTARKYGQHPPRSGEIRHDTRESQENRQHALERRGDDRIVIDRNKREGDRPRIYRDRQEQERLERTRKERELIDRNRQGQQRVEPERQQRIRDNFFNRFVDGRREHPSSERGRASHESLVDGSRDQGRSGDVNQGGRGDRDRYRRGTENQATIPASREGRK